MHWSRDRWLVATTVVSGGAVLVGYVGFTALLLHLLGSLGGFVALLFGCLLFVFLVAGPPLTLRGVGANVVTAREEPVLVGLVSRLAQQGDVPTPAVAVVDSPEANAFTVGWRGDATVCVTTGLLDVLSRDELTTVLAHEVAHVANYDSSVMTVASLPTLVGLSTAEASVDVASKSLQAVFLGLFFGVLSALLVVLTAPVVVLLSRAREYAADRGAVALTGDAGALASALQTLTADRPSPPASDARDLGVVSAFCVVSPTSAPLPWLHPSTDRRIARLRELERTVETT
ncbi:M48 family metalloprotease [Halogranum rubrum]|uniref:Peptidase M48 domain-containing protein n=1 Tax=Halogranum salarium B-1 TaxID=1210908 RepID=J3JG68_9EURY|nr:M48 family metalloprotease [Halogranum salarium]EJN59831.1 hypothetical protein HSB1_19890 [Halogranum salarium B-1]